MNQAELENKIDLVKILDPRVHIGEKRIMQINVGGLNVTVLQQTANTVANSTLAWQVTTPSPQTILSRRCYVSYGVTLSDANTNTGAPGKANSQAPFFDQGEGPRGPYPLHGASSNVTFSLNGVSFSWQPDVIVGCLTQYDCFDSTTIESTCPQLQPQTLVLPSNVTGVTPILPNLVIPTSEFARDVGPLTNAAGGVIGSAMRFSEGCSSNNFFNYGGVYDNPAANSPLNVAYFAAEPVICPPFNHDSNSLCPGLYGVNQFSLTYNIASAGRFWHSNMMDIGAVVGTNTSFRQMVPRAGNLFVGGAQSPFITMIYITPQPDMVIPSIISYPCYEILKFETSTASAVVINAGQTQPISSNVISLQTIFQRLYIFAKTSKASVVSGIQPNIYGSPYTDSAYNETCGLLKSVSITFNNASGLLSTATPQDLYHISKKNGLKTSFPHWTAGLYTNNNYRDNPDTSLVYAQGCGSVLCVESTDLSIPPQLSAGCNGVFNLVVRADVFNPFINGGGLPGLDGIELANNDRVSENLPFQLFVIPVNSGLLQYNCSNGQWTKLIGNLTSADVLNAPTASEDYFKRDRNMYGGMRGAGFFDDLLSGVKKGLSVVKGLAPVVSGIASMIPDPRAQMVAQGANAAGDVLGNLGFGKKRRAPLKKKRGGAALSRGDLL